MPMWTTFTEKLMALKHLPGNATPLLREILENENWYDDGPPQWRNATTAEQAGDRSTVCFERVMRFGLSKPGIRELSSALFDCAPDNRCLSGACAECSRAFQRWFVANVRRLTMATDPQSWNLVVVSVVFPDATAKRGKLDEIDVVNVRRHFGNTLNNAGPVAWVVAGFDVSLNDDSAKGLGAYWQLHLHGIAKVEDPLVFSSRLREQFARSSAVSRPIQVKSTAGSNSAISYCFKTEFVRRVSYLGEAGPTDARRKCWRTRKVSLRPREHVEVLFWIHSTGLARRLFLRGARMTRTANGVQISPIGKLD